MKKLCGEKVGSERDKVGGEENKRYNLRQSPSIGNLLADHGKTQKEVTALEEDKTCIIYIFLSQHSTHYW